jgi:hypothetical protein
MPVAAKRYAWSVIPSLPAGCTDCGSSVRVIGVRGDHCSCYGTEILFLGIVEESRALQLIVQDFLDLERSIGLSVTTTGGADGLAVYGVGLRSYDHGGSVYTPINFADPAQARSSSTVFTGVPVGPTDPMLGASFQPEFAVTNFGNTPANSTVHYSFTRLGQVQTDVVAHIVVPPVSTRTVSMPDLQADQGMQNSFVIESSANPGELYASMRSVSSSTPWVADVLGLDAKQLHNGGLHPWNIADGTTSTLLLFNHTQATQAFHVLIAQGATIWQKIYHLGALETRAISLNSLVASVVNQKLVE